MMYFYLIRHGETLFNTYHRMQGWCDTPLTKRGIEQAENVTMGMRDIPYTKVYTSDSGRAMETASYLAAAKGIKPYAMSGFREMFFGTMEGLDTDTGRKKDKEYRNRYGWVDVGGENMEQLETRMFNALESILPNDAHQEEHIVIVSHGIAIMSIIHRLDRAFFEQLEDYGGVLENTSVTTIAYDNGQYQIIDFNNTTYQRLGGKRRNEKNHE